MSKKQLDTRAIADDLSSSLFFRPPTEQPAPPAEGQQPTEEIQAEPRKRGTAETRKHVSTELPRSSPVEQVPGTPRPSIGELFNLSVAVNDKRTIDFTTDEIDILDDIKREVKRKYGIRITQYNIVRCALRHLFENYYQEGEQSVLVERARGRK